MAGLGDEAAPATVEGSVDANGIALVRLGGELDIASVPGVEEQLEPILAGAPERVAFDLSAVTFMDSSGIAMLLRVTARANSFEVRNPSPSVQLVIEATGLTDIFRVES